MADNDTFDADDAMATLLRNRAPPPPVRNPSRSRHLLMLTAVVAASVPANIAFRRAVAITSARNGSTDTGTNLLRRAIAPGGHLHTEFLQPATQRLRTLANAAAGATLYMFKPGKCPKLMHKDTVWILTAAGNLVLAWTICCVSGKVGCGLNYKEANGGRLCQGWKCDLEWHHVSSSEYDYGLCFLQSALNGLVEMIVWPTPSKGIPDKNIEDTYEAYSPTVIIQNIYGLKLHEDRIKKREVRVVEYLQTRGGTPSTLLLGSFMRGGDNFGRLRKADSRHLELAGVDEDAEGIYQFRATSRPAYVDESCVFQLYKIYSVYHPEGQDHIRVLHCRCPILGIGGTKVGGGGSGVPAKFNKWPVVAHHLGRRTENRDTLLSLVSFCHNRVNQAVSLLR